MKENIVFRKAQLLIILIISVISNKAFSQKDFEVKIVLDTAKTQTLPSDLKFTMKIPNSIEKPIKWVYLFQLDNKNKIATASNTSFESFNKKSFIKQWKTEKKLQVVLNPLQGNYAKDTVSLNVSPLNPNKNYLVLAVDEGDFKSTISKRLKEYIEDSKLNKISKTPEDLKIQLVPDMFQLDSKLRLAGAEDKIFMNKVKGSRIKDEFDKAKDKGIENLFRINDEELELIQSNNENFPGPFPFPIFIEKDTTISFNSSSDLAKHFEEDFHKINGALNYFKEYDSQLIYGEYALKSNDSGEILIDKKDASDITKQYQNIINTRNIMFRTRESLFVLADIRSSTIDLYINYVNEKLDNLIKNEELLADRIKIEEEIDKIITAIDLPDGLKTSSAVKTTFNYDFLIRSSAKIKPIIGFLNYMSEDDEFSGVAPFAGVEYLMRPTNVNTDFKGIMDWKKYISFQIGVPILAQNLNDGIRTKHLIGDSFSLYTGIGINLNHAIKIGYGPLWFKTLDDRVLDVPVYKTSTLHTFSISFNDKLWPLIKNMFNQNSSIISK